MKKKKKILIFLFCAIGVIIMLDFFVFRRTMKVEKIVLLPEQIELEDNSFSCSIHTIPVSNPFSEVSPKGYTYRIVGEKLYIKVKYTKIGKDWPQQIFIKDNLVNIKKIYFEDNDKNKLVYER